MALYGVIHAMDDSRDCFVIAAKSQFIDERFDIWMLVDVLIDCFQRINHGICAEHLALMLLCYTEIRRQTGNGSVCAQHLGAERVNCRDLRRIDQMHLVLDVFVAGGGGQSLRQFGRDFGPQFGRSCFRVGNDEKIIDILILITNLRHNAVYQHFRFARTGCCRNQQITAAIGNNGLLLRCKRYFLFFGHNYSPFVYYVSKLYHIRNNDFYPHWYNLGNFLRPWSLRVSRNHGRCFVVLVRQ